jgi:hypothetical protein
VTPPFDPLFLQSARLGHRPHRKRNPLALYDIHCGAVVINITGLANERDARVPLDAILVELLHASNGRLFLETQRALVQSQGDVVMKKFMNLPENAVDEALQELNENARKSSWCRRYRRAA